MNEVFIMQPNSSLFYLSESMCSLDVNTTIKYTNKSPTGQVTGKKIVTSVQVPMVTSERSQPSTIYIKKIPVAKHIQKSGTKPRSFSSKRPEKCESKPAPKQPAAQPARPKREKPMKRKPKPQEPPKAIEKTYIGNVSIKPKIKQIIKLTLKKEKLNKVMKLKEKKGEEELKELKRLEMDSENLKIRNYNKKCKKIRLAHKYSWGVDQSRLRDSRRNSVDRASSRKAKSTERVRTGLDAIKEIQLELGNPPFHYRALSQKDEMPKQSYRVAREPDPQLMRFMRVKEIKRKEKIDFERLHKLAEDSRKQSQLSNIELIYRQPKIKPKHRKNRKSKNYSKIQKPEVAEKDEDFTELKSLNLVYDEKAKESENDITFKEQINNKVPHNSAKGKDDRLKKRRKVEESDPVLMAIIKIQSHIRRFLVQRRLIREFDFNSEDEQIKHILDKRSINKTDQSSDILSSVSPPKKSTGFLQIEIPSSSHSERIGSYNPSSSISAKNSDFSSIVEIEEKHSEYQEKLRSQLIIREAQLQSLEQLKQKEMQDIKEIARKSKENPRLAEVLSKVVEKRYSQLTALLEKSRQEDEGEIFKEMSIEEFQNELEAKREELNKIIESGSSQEHISFGSEKSEEENRPFIYKPSQLSMLSIEVSEIQHLSENPHVNSMLSPSAKESYLQESTIKPILTDSDKEGSLGMFVEEFQVSSPSSESIHESDRIEISSPSLDLRIQFNPEGKDSVFVDDISMEISSSLNNPDSSLFGQLKIDQSSVSYTPDYIPERPSAPLNYLDSQRESPLTNPSAGIESSSEDLPADESIDVEWISNIPVEVTPNLVLVLSEFILTKILYEQISIVHKKRVPQLTISGGESEEPQINTDSESIRKYAEKVFTKCGPDVISTSVRQPLTRKPLDALNKLQELESGSCVENDFWPYPEIISVNLYLNIEESEDVRRTAELSSLSERTKQLLIESEHIHDKLIFDAINEALQKYRPFGLKGLPMPWSTNSRVASSAIKAEVIVTEVLERIEKWSQAEIGKIPTEEMELSNGDLDEELLQQIREDKLAALLADEIIEKDDIWIDYEFEETQAKIDISDMVLEILCVETIALLE